MREAQEILGELLVNGWTKAAIADEMGVAHFTVERWEKGRRPANAVGVALALESLARRRRVPKRRRYTKSPPARES